MFDILVFLFESYIDAGSYPDSDKLSKKLSAAGFEDDDIRSALTWLSGLNHLSKTAYPVKINQSGLRCYAELETQRISIEARSFLMFCEQSGLITPLEREMIIDRAIAMDSEDLPLDKIKLITLMVLWNLRNELDPMLAEELLIPVGAELLH